MQQQQEQTLTIDEGESLKFSQETEEAKKKDEGSLQSSGLSQMTKIVKETFMKLLVATIMLQSSEIIKKSYEPNEDAHYTH